MSAVAERDVSLLTAEELATPLKFKRRNQEYRLGNSAVSIFYEAEHPPCGGPGDIEVIGRPTARHTFNVALGPVLMGDDAEMEADSTAGARTVAKGAGFRNAALHRSRTRRRGVVGAPARQSSCLFSRCTGLLQR